MNNAKYSLVKLVLCGPCDVENEIKIAQQAVEKWNLKNGEARGFWVKHSHWKTDVYPEIASRTQDVPNQQIIDPADILVALFWSRFGTPTGIAESGTKEEIFRAVNQGKKVMIYFSDLEPTPRNADQKQLESLWQFRQEIRQRGICFSFKARSEFEKMFENHLMLALNAFDPIPIAPKRGRRIESQISQKAQTGKGNIYQTIDNSKTYNHPPAEKIIRERRPGSVTVQEEYQIRDWIYDLAEGEVGVDRHEAYKKWGGIFKTHFGLNHRGDLLSSQMLDAKKWYDLQKVLQKNGYRTRAPDAYQIAKIASIKAAMNQMGAVKEDYYSELSYRLKLRKPFISLKKLTLKNLDRVYRMVRTDLKRWENTGSWRNDK